MAPIVLPILQALVGVLPQLGQWFGSGSEVANRNVAAGTLIAEKLVQVTQSVNLQEAAEKIQNDPQALQQAKEAVADVAYQLSEAGGGGIKGARDAAQAAEGDWRKLVFNQATLAIVALLPLVYFVVYHVITKDSFSQEIKASVVSAIISGVLFAIVGYCLGSSYGSQRKDNMLGPK